MGNLNEKAVSFSEKTLNIADFLRTLDSSFIYYPNPGNAGDSLIASATFAYFEQAQLNYTVATRKHFDAKGKTLVYAGGGNFGGSQSRVGQFLKEYSQVASHIVILPHTLFGAETLLKELPNNVHIICRERVSYEHATAQCKNASVYLHNDMVIDADINHFIAVPTSQPPIAKYIFQDMTRRIYGERDNDLGIAVKCALRFLFTSPHKSIKKGYVLNAFREDVEKTDIAIPEDNVDLSDIYELSACSAELARYSTHLLLTHIQAFDTIKTNRLHVAIAAMKLGKKVHLYGNNYFKIKAIYDYSIKGKFKNVTWQD